MKRTCYPLDHLVLDMLEHVDEFLWSSSEIPELASPGKTGRQTVFSTNCQFAMERLQIVFPMTCSALMDAQALLHIIYVWGSHLSRQFMKNPRYRMFSDSNTT